MRVDRFLEARFPGLSFSHIQRIVRKGELRVNGKRVDSKDRLEAGPERPHSAAEARHAEGRGRTVGSRRRRRSPRSKAMTLYEDDDVLVLNKPIGLAVQGGSGTTRHIDQMLEVMRDAKGQKPRLVHRHRQGHGGLPADRQDALCRLASDRRRSARARRGRSIGRWSPGVPKPKQGRISTFLAKEESEDDTIMRIAAAWRRGREPRGDLLRGGRDRRQQARLGVAEAGDRAHPSAARAHGAYRPSHRRRSQIFQHRELGAAGRPAEPAASAGAPHRHSASARRRDRRHRAAAAAHAAVVESARARRRAASIRSRTRRRSRGAAPLSTPGLMRNCASGPGDPVFQRQL